MFSFEKPMKYMGKKALLPPLGLITVAAILPQKWEFKLVDRNIKCQMSLNRVQSMF